MRYLLLSVLAFGLAPAASAQATFGVRGGLNASSFVGVGADDLEGFEPSSALGLVVGAFAEVPLSGWVAVRPEVLYSQKGLAVSGDVLGAGLLSADGTLNLDYVEVPVLVRIGLPIGPALDAGLLVGPTFAFKVNESLDVGVEGVPIDLDGVIGLFSPGDEDAFESFDAGLALGVEVGSGPFYVDLRYTLGLLDTNRVEDALDADVPTVRNGVFSVTGALKFGS